MQDVTKSFRLPSLYTHSISYFFISTTTLFFDGSFLPNVGSLELHILYMIIVFLNTGDFAGCPIGQRICMRKNFRDKGHQNRDTFNYHTKDLRFSSVLKSKTEIFNLKKF